MNDPAAMARELGCSRRTLERWREDPTFPMPEKREKLAAWAKRVRAWRQARLPRNGPVFGDGAAPKPSGENWVEQGQKALALMRLQNLKERRAQFLTKQEVYAEWQHRALFTSRKLLALPRALAAHVPSALAEVVEREAMAVVRELLIDFTRDTPATPATPPPSEERTA